MDNTLQILADYIVSNKRDVISFLNENGYGELRPDAPIIEVNMAVSKHILDRDFVEKLANLIFGNFRGVDASTVSSASQSTESANPATWIVKMLEVGSLLVLENERIKQQDRELQAQYTLAEQQLEQQSLDAKEKAKQDFAFNLLRIQRKQATDKTVQNVILLGGVMAFLFIAYNATKRRPTS